MSLGKRNLIAIICGLCATLAYAPIYLFPLLFPAFSGLLYLINHAASPRKAFFVGWWFGMGYFVSGLYWFAYALLTDAAKFGWMIPFAVLGISAILAIYHGLASWLTFRWRMHGKILPLIFALNWLLMEWLRAHLLSGFPWNLVSASWMISDVSIQAFSLVGPYILGFVTVWAAASFFSLSLWERVGVRVASPDSNSFFVWKVPSPRPSPRGRGSLPLILPIILIVGGAIRLNSAHHDTYPDINIRIIQPNITQALKWQPQGRIDAIRTLYKMSKAPATKPLTHIIWPETAMTYEFNSNDFWAQNLAQIVPPKGLLFTGVVRREGEWEDSNVKLFNSLQAVDEQANIAMHYDKVKLVPFGEFVPFRHILPLEKITPGGIDFSAGEIKPPFKTAGLPAFRPLICYEAIFPQMAENIWPGWLLMVTNDAWFGTSSGPYQHLEMARARAVEQGVPLLRAANTGVSVVVDAYGRILQSIPLNQAGVIDTALPKATPTPTFYSVYGKWLEWMFLFIAALFSVQKQCASFCTRTFRKAKSSPSNNSI